MYEHPFIGASTGLSVGSEEVPSIRPFFHLFDIPSMHRSVYLRTMLAVFKRNIHFYGRDKATPENAIGRPARRSVRHTVISLVILFC